MNLARVGVFPQTHPARVSHVPILSHVTTPSGDPSLTCVKKVRPLEGSTAALTRVPPSAAAVSERAIS